MLGIGVVLGVAHLADVDEFAFAGQRIVLSKHVVQDVTRLRFDDHRPAGTMQEKFDGVHKITLRKDGCRRTGCVADSVV